MKVKYFVILTIFIILVTSEFLANKLLNTNYSNLSNTDKSVLDEYNKFYSSNSPTWKDFDLKDNTIVVINTSAILGDAFIINPTKTTSKFLTQEIQMPKHFSIKVFRISKLSLGRLQFMIGNFNTKNKKYSISNQDDIFYLKYTKKDSLDKKGSSSHFLPMLVHEAFHYYSQKDWSDSSFRGETYNNNELDLLHEEYLILDKINLELKSKNSSIDKLLTLANDYLKVMEKRIRGTNTVKINKELAEETMEGTAQYVGIKAAKMINYDFDVMYFSNKKNVLFSEVVPTIKKGLIDQSVLSSNIIYDSGAVLCNLLEKVDSYNWQEKLNGKNINQQVTLYSLIKATVEQQKKI